MPESDDRERGSFLEGTCEQAPDAPARVADWVIADAVRAIRRLARSPGFVTASRQGGRGATRVALRRLAVEWDRTIEEAQALVGRDPAAVVVDDIDRPNVARNRFAEPFVMDGWTLTLLTTRNAIRRHGKRAGNCLAGTDYSSKYFEVVAAGAAHLAALEGPGDCLGTLLLDPDWRPHELQFKDYRSLSELDEAGLNAVLVAFARRQGGRPFVLSILSADFSAGERAQCVVVPTASW